MTAPSETAPGAAEAWHAQPHPVSGTLDCAATVSFEGLVEVALQAGWSTDGIHPEPPLETVASLLERRQPRPRHFGDGLLSTRCCRVVAVRPDGTGYASALAPRKASGPDLAYLFIGGEGRLGHIARATVALVRPAPRYLRARGQLDEGPALLRAAGAIALLDPLSVRRLDWPGRSLEAWVPLRTAGLTAHQAALEALGLTVAVESEVPMSARLAAAFPGQGSATLHASGPYALLAALDAQVGAAGSPPSIEMRYCDAHGALALVTGAADRLVELLDWAADEPGWDDLWLRHPDGSVRGLPGAFALDPEEEAP